MNVCQRYRKHGEKIRAFASVTDRGGHSAVTVRGFISGLSGGKGRIIGTPRASGDCVRSTDSRGMKAESMLGETAGKKWDRAMEIDCSGYFKAARPTAPAIKDRNYDKNIHVTSTNDVRSNFGRSNDFTSKAENIGHLKALPMDRRIPMSGRMSRRTGAVYPARRRRTGYTGREPVQALWYRLGNKCSERGSSLGS